MEGASRRLIACVVCIVSVLAAPACAPSSVRERSINEPLDSPDAIVAVGCAGEIAYGLTRNHELHAWNWLRHAFRTLDRGGAVGLARDGAIALRRKDTTIDAWEPSSGRVVATKRFEHRFDEVRAVSRVTAYVVANRQLLSWNLASGKIDVVGGEGCKNLWTSVDGTRTLCDLSWGDRLSGARAKEPELAPEWAPPEPPERDQPHGPPVWRGPAHELLSAWLAADGLTAYVTYWRTVGGDEWRLDRWTPDPTGKTAGRLEHLVASHEPVFDSVVAASADGRTILTNTAARPPVLRHAPQYDGVPLLAPPVTSAVFCDDDQLIVTGHGDGRLRLWAAHNGWFSAITPE